MGENRSQSIEKSRNRPENRAEKMIRISSYADSLLGQRDSRADISYENAQRKKSQTQLRAVAQKTYVRSPKREA